METASDLPLFPLNTVLFPGGLLPLRVFEPRYVDMVSDCLKHGGEFGVCLIVSGKEVGAPAEPAEIGCRARIVDWNMEQPGVLQIMVAGTRRFRVLSSTATSAGLVHARTVDLPDDVPEDIPEEHAACTRLLRRILTELEQQGRAGAIAQPWFYDDASWVANRLAEMLPLPLPARHDLMALEGGLARLARVHRTLAEHDAL